MKKTSWTPYDLNTFSSHLKTILDLKKKSLEPPIPFKFFFKYQTSFHFNLNKIVTQIVLFFDYFLFFHLVFVHFVGLRLNYQGSH